MRESLTIFAIAVIFVLSALLIGPYFIDWSGQRDWLASKLSKAMGAEVHIEGPVDVRLLPRPIFRAGRISIGTSKPHEPRFSADRLDAELSLNGLMQGAVDFVDARLASPRIELTLRRDGTLIASPFDIASPQKIQFGKLTISDGTVAVLDEAGRETAVIRGIAAEGQAETLFGPLKLSGSAVDGQGRTTFRLTTGAYANRKLRTRVVVDRKGGWTHAEAEGQIALSPKAAPAVGQAGVGFAGSVTISGALQVAAAAAPVPWIVAASALTADPQQIAAPAIELRAGAEGRAMVATGGILMDFGANPAGVVKLHARQLDLDNIAVAPDVAPDTPRPSAAQWLAALRQALENDALPALRLSADVGVDAVTRGDLTLTEASMRIDAQPGQRLRAAVSVKGPDDTRIALEGAVAGGVAPAFEGNADLSTRRLGTAAAWLDPIWPGLAAWAGNGLADRAAAFKGDVALSGAGIAAKEATLTLGGTALSGALSFTTGSADQRPRLVADVTADALDAGLLSDLRGFAALADPLDLGIALRSDAVRLSGGDSASAASGQVSLHLTKTGKLYALDRFTITGLEGTTVSGTATLDADRRLHANGRADAKNPQPLANLVRQLVPGGLSDAFASRAGTLAPLDVGFDAEATLDDGDRLSPTRLSISGSAGATRLSASITPELKGGSTADVDLSLALDAPEGGKLLEQAGWHVDGQLGAIHADLRGHGNLAAGLETSATATLPGARLSFDGRIEADGGGRGRLSASGTDAALPLRLAGVDRSFSDRGWSGAANLSWAADGAVSAHAIAARLNGSTITGDLDYGRATAQDATAPATVTGALAVDSASLGALTQLVMGPPPESGVAASPWSTQPFGRPAALPVTDVALRFGGFDLWPGLIARDGSLRLGVRPGAVSLTGMSGHLLGGAIGGDLAFRRNGAGASLTGKVTLDGIALSLPSVSGRLSGLLDVAGTGATPASLVGSLGGDGQLTLADAVLPRLDPGALGRVAASFDHEDAAVEDGPVRDALSGALDRASLPLGSVSGSATIAAGTVRLALPKLPVANGSATVAAEAAFDLEDLSLTLKTTLSAAELPREWKGDPPRLTVTWKGPLNAPARDLDAGAFVNGLAARAIAREQDRIELMKDDLRERAFFARRLRQIEAEQQAERAAAQAPKVVPQPPSRPGDIRLPKPPDVGPPLVAPVKPAQSSAGEDGITKLLDALNPSAPTKPAPARPIELSPSPRPAAQAAPAPTQQDPGTQGRY